MGCRCTLSVDLYRWAGQHHASCCVHAWPSSKVCFAAALMGSQDVCLRSS